MHILELKIIVGLSQQQNQEETHKNAGKLLILMVL